MKGAVGKPDSCRSCPLYAVGEGFVRGSGPLTSPLLFVGEAPGETEARLGLPFVGQAGYMLDQLLRMAGIDRAGVRIANTICCRPPRNFLFGAPYEHQAIKACAPFLDEEIARTAPRVIVTLGNIALRRVLAMSGIKRLRGYPQRLGDLWVVPTYHPSYLLPRIGQKETAKLTGIVTLDLKRAAEIAANGFEPASREGYALDISPAQFALYAARYESALRDNPGVALAWDIETPGKLKTLDEEETDDEVALDPTILRFSCCFEVGRAVSVPWTADYKDVVRRLLEHPTGPKVGWNSYAFDTPIMALNGITPHGPQWDGMWAWHLYQSDLPRGLESVTSHYAPELLPWKHLAEAEPARYSAQDADATLRCMNGIRAHLQERGQWDLFERHVVALQEILFQAGRVHGVAIDREAQDALRIELRARQEMLLREAQAVVPREFHAQKIYVRAPKDLPVEPVPGKRKILFCGVCGQERVNRTHLRKCPTGFLRERFEAVEAFRYTPAFDELHDDALLEAIDVAGFNPNSPVQLSAFAKAQGHRIGENYKTGRDSLDKQVLTRLVRQHGKAFPIYPIAAELRELSKTLGTYIDGYRPDRRGRIYTSYSFAPSTGRLSSRNVNLQNVSRRSALRHASSIRRTIVPTPGHVFVEADSRAIEAVMTGHFMGDDEYIKLAKEGIHDYLTCLEFDWPFEPQFLAPYRKDPKYEEARERNKRVVHGTNYGMTPKMMVMNYPEFFTSGTVAAAAQARYFAACARLGPWQHEVRLAAHRQHYLINPWGYRHYFFQVFAKRGKTVELGPDAKRAVAFLPQSSAAAFMRDSLLLLGASEWAECTPAILSIHDSICLDVPEARVSDAAAYLTALMSRPIAEMGGLTIDVEVKTGSNWAEMRRLS